MDISKELCERMEHLIQKTIKASNLRDRFSPEEVAEKLGLTIRNGSLHQIDGFFHDDSKVIVINSEVKLERRKRFTLFHEICHFLLRNDEEFFSDINDLYDDDEEFRKAEERLCDIGAAEFLMPKEKVSSLISEYGLSISLLFELEKQFHVSKQSAMWRMAECANHPCILAIYLPEYETSKIINIKVECAWNSNQTRYKLKKTAIIPGDHPIWKSYDSPSDVFSVKSSFIQFYTGKQMSAHVEGVWVNGRAYVIFHL